MNYVIRFGLVLVVAGFFPLSACGGGGSTPSSGGATSRAVRPGIEALMNFPTKKILRPQEEYSAKVEMFADPGLSMPVTFRLGFRPRAERPVADLTDFSASGGVYWSNPITLRGR
ncbi:MAG: hypothetical protein ACYC9L_17030 [Sulfuricaulis sp.]